MIHDFEPGNPFGESPWRKAKGALWDIGPHALSVLLPVLGPAESVAAQREADQRSDPGERGVRRARLVAAVDGATAS